MLGPLIGFTLWGKLGDYLTDPITKEVDFSTLFLYPLGFGLLAALILALFFHPKAKDPVPEEIPVLVN